MKKGLWKYVTPITLLIIIFGFALSGHETNKKIWQTIWESQGNLSEAVTEIQDTYKEAFPLRNDFIDLYGITYRLLGKRIVGDFEFIRGEDDITYLERTAMGTEYIVGSILELRDTAKTLDTPLVYVIEPDPSANLPVARSGELKFYGRRSKIIGEILQENQVDCLDMEKLMASDADAPSISEFYLKTDEHCATLGEFWMAKKLAEYLSEEYGLLFLDKEIVFDLNNYAVAQYEFLGNLGRSVGRYFMGTDQFEEYIPQFATELTLYNPSASVSRNGDFVEVMQNGYEKRGYDEWTYWITNFGQYPYPYYHYTNDAAPSEAPSILIVADSTFMRSFTYLALACRKVTVVDPRAFNGMDYLANALALEHFDAIIFAGQFADLSFASKMMTLPNLPEKELISREEYGEWIANQGICLDTYNDIRLEGSTTIPIDSGANSVKLYGWAADFRNDAPFRELYLQVGDILLQCDYGIDRAGVVDHFGKDSLLKTGFQITFPTNYLQDGAVTEVSFIGISADGAYLYTPVTYELGYMQK